MAIKATVNTPAQKEITFPCLMQSKTDGQVILFSALNRGVLLRGINEEDDKLIGMCRDDWIRCTDSTVWQPIQSITLEMVD